jgi:hypothetical protein
MAHSRADHIANAALRLAPTAWLTFFFLFVAPSLEGRRAARSIICDFLDRLRPSHSVLARDLGNAADFVGGACGNPGGGSRSRRTEWFYGASLIALNIWLYVDPLRLMEWFYD